MKSLFQNDMQDRFEEFMGKEGFGNQEFLGYHIPEENIELASGEDDIKPAIKTNLTKEVKKPGRKPREDTILLSKFKRKSGKPLNKEFVRITLIRKHKKLNRLFETKCTKEKELTENNKNKAEFCRNFNKLEDIFNTNKDVLLEASKTENGPMTDGKSKRKNENEKSCNNKFVQDYFNNETIKESYYYFLELRFSDSNPQSLEKYFKFSCCPLQPDGDNSKCHKNWDDLKKYLQIKMFEDLKINPWKPEDLIEILPRKLESPVENNFFAGEIDQKIFQELNANPEEIDINIYKI